MCPSLSCAQQTIISNIYIYMYVCIHIKSPKYIG